MKGVGDAFVKKVDVPFWVRLRQAYGVGLYEKVPLHRVVRDEAMGESQWMVGVVGSAVWEKIREE